MQQLLREWERLQLRDCDYKNHRIFTLRCIHKELVPVHIRLKTTLRREKARKIVRSAEKQLLQARIKTINSILDNNAKQIELCRSKLASILSTPSYRKCQEFIEKAKDIRFNKVKKRQVRKFNHLLNKKEGNITWETTPATRTSPQASGKSQAGSRQVPPFPRTTLLPRKPTLSVLTAVLPRKVALVASIPRKEAISLPLTQATIGTQSGLGLPRQTVLFLRQIVRSPRPALPRQLVALVLR